MFGKYIPSDMSAEMQDLRLYRAWVEDYEKGEERHRRGTDTIREAEGDHSEVPQTFQEPSESSAPAPKKLPKSKAAPKQKTSEQLARAVTWLELCSDSLNIYICAYIYIYAFRLIRYTYTILYMLFYSLYLIYSIYSCSASMHHVVTLLHETVL